MKPFLNKLQKELINNSETMEPILVRFITKNRFQNNNIYAIKLHANARLFLFYFPCSDSIFPVVELPQYLKK